MKCIYFANQVSKGNIQDITGGDYRLVISNKPIPDQFVAILKTNSILYIDNAPEQAILEIKDGLSLLDGATYKVSVEEVYNLCLETIKAVKETMILD